MLTYGLTTYLLIKILNMSNENFKEGDKQNHSNDETKPVKKLITIYVNGSPEQVEKEEMSYDEIVALGFPDFPQHPERNYSIKYTRGHGNKPEGILSPGGKVKVKHEMEFTVTPTGQS